MKDRFKVIGYYICEINDTPRWLQEISGWNGFPAGLGCMSDLQSLIY